MNIKEIKEMLQLMAEHDLAEMELEKEGLKIKFKKTSSGKLAMESYHPGHFAPAPMPLQRFDTVQVPGGSGAQTPESSNSAVIKSPMVGTFYVAPAPDQPPYVSVGKQVKEGDVLCIVEAMKLMNEIKAEVSGTITEILVKNGQAIEFDQPLFKIEKS